MHPNSGVTLSTCIILNPHAGTAAQATAVRDMASRCPDLRLCETSGPGHATVLAAEALQAGCGLIVAAGGDGTINEVVNGLASNLAGATLGIIPLGTGNDLARTLALPTDPLAAWQVVVSGVPRHLDLLTIETAGRPPVYGINMAVGGFTGEMNEHLTGELKQTWGPLAYVLGTTRALPELTTYKILMTCDNGPVERLQVLNVAVANGRTAAGGYAIAPRANPEDGWLDLVIVRAGSLVALAGLATRLLTGTFLDSEYVLHRRVRRLRLYSRPAMWCNVDGELYTREPLTVSVQPRALRVIVGPTYTPDPLVHVVSDAK